MCYQTHDGTWHDYISIVFVTTREGSRYFRLLVGVCVRNQDTDCLHVVYDDSSGFICIFLISNRTGEIGPRHLHFGVVFASVCETRTHHECT